MPALLVDGSAGQWDDYQRQLAGFIRIGYRARVARHGPSIGQYCGQYRDEATGRTLSCTLRLDGDVTALEIVGAPRWNGTRLHMIARPL